MDISIARTEVPGIIAEAQHLLPLIAESAERSVKRNGTIPAAAIDMQGAALDLLALAAKWQRYFDAERACVSFTTPAAQFSGYQLDMIRYGKERAAA